MANQDVIDSILGEEYSNKNKEIAQAIEKVEVKEKAEVKTLKSEKTKELFKPGVGVDVGTSNIVVSRMTEDGAFINRFHRDMLYPLEMTEESVDLLERSDYNYVKVNDIFYIVGEDALRLVNAIGRGEIVRPMKDGILNPNLKESSELLFCIIKAVVGEPMVANETLRFSVPANPVDANINNTFHKIVLQQFFAKLGYNAKPINEAMAIIYDCNPIMKTKENNEPLTGVSISFGGGMSNVCLAFRGMELGSFSILKSGDYIDAEASKATGVPLNRIIRIKEKDLDLLNVDYSNKVLVALAAFYDEIIERVVHLSGKEFSHKGSEVDGEIEIIIAGGTSLCNGFCTKFEEIVKKSKFPFKIYKVRHSSTPFFSVANGSCIRAISDWNKVDPTK